MARSSLAVFAQVNDNQMDGARAKKEVQEQETTGYACYLPKMTAQQQKKAASQWRNKSKEDYHNGSPQL